MYVRWRNFRGYRNYATTPWLLLLMPGVGLILMALAILVWPELLAYMIAFALLAAGIMLTGWALTMRSAQKSRGQQQQENVHQTTHYEVL